MSRTIKKISKPYQYEGYSSADHNEFERRSTYVSMSDGEPMAADIYLPTQYIGEGVIPEQFPTIFIFTCYQRGSFHPQTHKWEWTASRRPGVGSDFFLRHGYAMVIADTRGTGASGGSSQVFGWRYQDDAGEMVNWIAEQGWCDGNIGMIGGSHVGWTQLAAASRKPPALKAIMPAVVPFDGFTGQFFPGGIAMYSFINQAELSDAVSNELGRTRNRLSAPVCAEPDQLADWEEVLKLASLERPELPSYDWDNEPFIDTKCPSGEIGRDICSNLVGGVAESGVAIYHLGGWFDGFTRGSCELYATLAATNPSRLAMFPGYHDLLYGFMYDEFGAEAPDLLAERLRFFDRYLKGINNGIENDPPVLIYNMQGDGWRSETEWPLARQVETKYYLGTGYSLSDRETDNGSDSLEVNLRHDRRYGTNLSSRWTGLFAIPPQGAPDMTAQDADSMCYTTSPLHSNTEVTGHPVVRLWVSADAGDIDVFAYLEDVDEKGRSLMVTEGQLRSGWASLQDKNSATDCDIEVQPGLPWHGYEKDQYQPGLLENDRVVELVFDLQPTSWTFKAGHRIRLAITGANWPDFELHPKLSPGNNPDAENNVLPTIQIQRRAGYRSSITLPVIP
jgi:putative CocE/NonD family hydrolase